MRQVLAFSHVRKSYDRKTVLGSVQEGVAETRALLERYKEVATRLAADYSGDLLDEMGRLQEQPYHRDAWDLDARVTYRKLTR